MPGVCRGLFLGGNTGHVIDGRGTREVTAERGVSPWHSSEWQRQQLEEAEKGQGDMKPQANAFGSLVEASNCCLPIGGPCWREDWRDSVSDGCFPQRVLACLQKSRASASVIKKAVPTLWGVLSQVWVKTQGEPICDPSIPSHGPMFLGLHMYVLLGQAYHMQGMMVRWCLKLAAELQWEDLESYVGPFLMLLQESRYFRDNGD